MSHSKCVRKGLSLLELVVVLGILAILAGITIQSLEPVADQARYDATVRTLQAIEDAYYQEQIIDGHRTIVRGFIADMGRLPLALDELWRPFDAADPTQPFHPYQLQRATLPDVLQSSAFSNLAVELHCGWNGPYIQPPQSTNSVPSLLDGWGRPFQLLATGGGNLQVTSMGADGNIDNVTIAQTTYSRDIRSTHVYGTQAEPGRLPHDEHTISISVEMLNPTSYASARVFALVYGPQNGLISQLPVQQEFDFAVGGQDVSNSGQPQTLSFAVPGLKIGPKAVLVMIIENDEVTVSYADWKTMTILPAHNPPMAFTIN